MANQPFVAGAIRDALRVLVAPGQVFEVRALKPIGRGFTASGYFNDIEAAAKAIQALDGKYRGVYITLNAVHEALLARGVNRMRQDKDLVTTNDTHIARRRWLLIDCDAKRIDSEVASTDDEHKAALQKAVAVREWLSLQGWPDPVRVDSGNGAHLLYRIDLPNTDEARDLCHDVLSVVAGRFDGDGVEIDQKVFNAARITKLPGTLVMKGDSTPERPHRRAMIIDEPGDLVEVSPDQLAAIARLKPAAPAPAAPRKAGPSAGKSYGQAALAAEIEKVRGAARGKSNDALFQAAASLYELVAGGELSDAEVETALMAAARDRGKSEGEARATIASGRKRGMNNPRSAPPPANGTGHQTGGGPKKARSQQTFRPCWRASTGQTA